jgi:hypothetical protein
MQRDREGLRWFFTNVQSLQQIARDGMRTRQLYLKILARRGVAAADALSSKVKRAHNRATGDLP